MKFKVQVYQDLIACIIVIVKKQQCNFYDFGDTFMMDLNIELWGLTAFHLDKNERKYLISPKICQYSLETCLLLQLLWIISHKGHLYSLGNMQRNTIHSFLATSVICTENSSYMFILIQTIF